MVLAAVAKKPIDPMTSLLSLSVEPDRDADFVTDGAQIE
jgi:hypothetical protein